MTWTDAAEEDPADKEAYAAEKDISEVDPLDTGTLIIRDFPADTDFYACGISEAQLKKMGIEGEDISTEKMTQAAVSLSESMSSRKKELIHADGMTFRGLMFGKTYLITGHTVTAKEGKVTPVPFLIRIFEDQRTVGVRVKYTIEKETSKPSSKTTGKTVQSTVKQSSKATAAAVKTGQGKTGSTVSLLPVKTGDIDLKEVGITILSALILGFAVIIRKKIK